MLTHCYGDWKFFFNFCVRVCEKDREIKIQAVLYHAGLKPPVDFVSNLAWIVNWCVRAVIFTPETSMHMTWRVSHNVYIVSLRNLNHNV